MNDSFQTCGEAHNRGSEGSENSGRGRTEAADTADKAENAANTRQRPRVEHMSQLVESPQREQLTRGYGGLAGLDITLNLFSDPETSNVSLNSSAHQAL